MNTVHFLLAGLIGATSSTDRIRVIAADELFEKDVVASDGKAVGEIEYVLIRTDDAHVQQVVIESELQGSAGQLIAVPFEAIEGQIYGEEIRLTTTTDKINQAPRVTEAQLNTLTDQTMITKIESYWMPFSEAKPQATPEKGLETEAIGEDREQTRVKKEHPSIDEVPDDPHSRTPGEPEMPGHHRTTGQQQMTGQPTAKAETTVRPAYLVLTKTAYRVLQPNATTTKDIEGMEVMSSDGKHIGEVEEVVIDLDSGCVAYTLVGRGGFLGLGMNYVAVPLQALEFTNADNLTLKVPLRQFNSMRGYLDDAVPRSVTRGDLQRVYKQFKITPYWTAKKEEMARK